MRQSAGVALELTLSTNRISADGVCQENTIFAETTNHDENVRVEFFYMNPTARYYHKAAIRRHGHPGVPLAVNRVF